MDICQAAIFQDEIALATLSHFAGLDIILYDNGLPLTPTMYLAAGNYLEAANFLLAKNPQGLRRGHAIAGAAWQGNQPYLQALLEETDNPKHLPNHLNWAVRGAAVADNRKLTEALLTEGASFEWFLLGAAASPSQILITEVLQSQKINPNNVFWAIKGAVQGGQHQLMQKLFLTYSLKDLSEFIYTAATTGNQVILDDLLSRDKYKNLSLAIEGAAYGSHLSLYETLIRKHPNPHHCRQYAITRAAEVGHTLLLLKEISASSQMTEKAEIAKKAQENNPQYSQTKLLGDAETLTYLITTYHLSFSDAIAVLEIYPYIQETFDSGKYLTQTNWEQVLSLICKARQVHEEIKTWGFLGALLTHKPGANGYLPPELYFHIFCNLLGYSAHAENIVAMVNAVNFIAGQFRDRKTQEREAAANMSLPFFRGKIIAEPAAGAQHEQEKQAVTIKL